MRIDLHVHSTASDGTESPTALAARAVSFAALAITDHDNCDGVGELMDAAEGPSRRIAGIELSIEPGEGFDRFHLLGLGIDHKNEGLRSFLKRVLDGRNARNERIVENFRRIGIEMGEEIASYAHGEVLARPHFARWLVEHGYARDVGEAFERHLLPKSPKATRCYEERWHPTQEEAFRVIHDAGGLCIMAHPKYWRDAWKHRGCAFSVLERGLAALREKGLDGVEAFYRQNTKKENVRLPQIALKLGYLISAGSDFHGSNKPHIGLGMNVEERLIAPLLERLGSPIGGGNMV